MYLERVAHKNPRGRVYFHFLVTGGRYGRRKYVSRAALQPIRDEIAREREVKQFIRILKSAARHGKPGPAPLIGEAQRIMLKRSGYNLRGGGHVTRDKKRFSERRQVEFRHSMLSEGLRRIARTPDDLARIERNAIALQAALSASKVRGGRFDICMGAMFSAEAASIEAAEGASPLSSARHS